MYGYKERDEEERIAYLKEISTIDSSTPVYLDESGIDDNETCQYACGPKGHRVHAMKNAYRDKRISIISALNKKKLKAPFVFEGYCNSKVFETYVERVLVPELVPGQTVVMDNASFHKSKKVRQMIVEAKCKLVYLPAYSPDFNPIEHYWSSIKQKIRTRLEFFQKDLFEAAEYAFRTGKC